MFSSFALLCVLLLASFSGTGSALAAPEAPSSGCNSYLLGDMQTGEILISHSAQERINPASVTKMMTALVLLDNVEDLSQTVTVGAEVNGFGPEASMMGLAQYETISYLDLLYGMMLVSGNDAAMTVAVSVGGSVEGFAEMMNAKAAELGMADTHFVNPHGMTNDEHYTTAADLFSLARACMANPTFAQVVATPSYTTAPTNKARSGHHMETTNRLLSTKESNASYRYEGAVGIKTGSTSAAQGCLVAAAQRDGRTLIAVLLGDDSYVNGVKYAKRWTDAASFFDYGFSLVRVDLVPLFAPLDAQASLPGTQGACVLKAQLPATLGYWTDAQTADALIEPGAVAFSVEYSEDFAVFAPMDSAVGTAVYTFDGAEMYRAPLYVQRSETALAQPATSSNPSVLHILLWAVAIVGLLVLLLVLLLMRMRRTRLR